MTDMMKIDKHIQIIRTNNFPFSSMHKNTARRLQDILQRKYTRVEISFIESLADLEQLAEKKPDLVFVGLKRVPKAFRETGCIEDDVWVSEYLQSRGIVCAGSSHEAIQLEFYKDQAKNRVSKHGLMTAPYFKAIPGEYQCAEQLPVCFPLFIKPLHARGAHGIDADSLVWDFETFQRKVSRIYERYGLPALVEKYLSGREFSVAILESGNSTEPYAMPVELTIEKAYYKEKFLSSRVKGTHAEKAAYVPEKHIRDSVSRLARQCFSALGGRGFGRIDIRMDENDTPYFMEANFLPGLSRPCYFSRACYLNREMEHQDVILHIAELGLKQPAISLPHLEPALM